VIRMLPPFWERRLSRVVGSGAQRETSAAPEHRRLQTYASFMMASPSKRNWVIAHGAPKGKSLVWPVVVAPKPRSRGLADRTWHSSKPWFSMLWPVSAARQRARARAPHGGRGGLAGAARRDRNSAPPGLDRYVQVVLLTSEMEQATTPIAPFRTGSTASSPRIRKALGALMTRAPRLFPG